MKFRNCVPHILMIVMLLTAQQFAPLVHAHASASAAHGDFQSHAHVVKSHSGVQMAAYPADDGHSDTDAVYLPVKMTISKCSLAVTAGKRAQGELAIMPVFAPLAGSIASRAPPLPPPDNPPLATLLLSGFNALAPPTV